jgi:radical SAM superfamily enzyme YgiQ (UPF0313 family)
VTKALLINPPRFSELIGKNPAVVEKHRGFNPPLGLLFIAGYVEAQSDRHEIEVLDAQPTGLSYAELEAEIRKRDFEVCGITAMTFTLIDVLKTCRLVRSCRPEAKIVLGGPHVHLFPDETIGFPEVDVLIQGEGEIAFLQLLDRLDDPAGWGDIPGIVYLDGDGAVVNKGVAPSTGDLDSLGFPARHKLDVGLYTSLLGRDDVVTTMMTSRGCPFRCTFCDRPYSPVISGFRWRSAEHIVDEMQQCIDLGIKEAFIYDDTFTVRKDRVLALCDEIERRGIVFRWDVRAHVNTINAELLRRMAGAGCDRIHLGVESGNDRMLKEIRKNTTVEKVRAAVRDAKASGMEVLCYFIIGQQTETEVDIRDTMRLARELDPNYAHFTIFCPYPGTEIYERGLREGVIARDVWREFARNPVDGFELPVWEETLTRAELREKLVECYKSFYGRPRYILRNLLRIRSTGELMRKLRAGISVMTMTPQQTVFGRRGLVRTVRSLIPNASYDANA